MDEQLFLVMDDRDEHWKATHPEEFAELEEKFKDQKQAILDWVKTFVDDFKNKN